MSREILERLKNIIQNCHLNLLVGSGCSMPFLSTLGNTEVLLTELSENNSVSITEKEIIRASILGKFFEEVIISNLGIKVTPSINPKMLTVLLAYQHFLTTINIIFWR